MAIATPTTARDRARRTLASVMRSAALIAVLATGLITSLGASATTQVNAETRAAQTATSTVIVDTGQRNCYSDDAPIACVTDGGLYSGQDAQYAGAQPSYQDNGNGTVTDLNTGLMWQQDPGDKMTYAQAVAGADAFALAGYDDWRLPTIKELYSLILFTGVTGFDAASSTPYLDTNYFVFEYGDVDAGERTIDAQFWSSTEYVGTTMGGAESVFGVNFADGRIKGYPKGGPNRDTVQFVRYVRGAEGYGQNDFVDNGSGTITDAATGLTWQQAGSAYALSWADALAYCELATDAGYDDWRLPNAKELQSIVDYNRAPDAQNPAQQGLAIDPLFSAGADAYYWTSTTHIDGPETGRWAVYIAFDEALGYMAPPGSSQVTLMNVHGAGAQRSDPKSGNPADYPEGHGPQGDVVSINNYARCVRGGDVVPTTDTLPASASPSLQGIPPQGAGIGQPQGGQGQSDGQPQAGQGAGQPQGGQGGPPQQAIDACAALSVNAACSFTAPQGSSISGTCQQVIEGLVCVPQGGGPGGPPPQQ